MLTQLGNLIDTGNKLALVDTGNIGGDGKINYSMVTDQIVPIAGLNGAFPMFIERIDPEKGTWIIGGGSDDKLTDEEAFWRLVQDFEN